jgi:hypothetical protein
MKISVTLSPVREVRGCATKRAEQERGLIGFHAYTRCPACEVMPAGYEAWGENGHKQGFWPVDTDVAWILERLALRFAPVTMGEPIDHQGPWSEAICPAYGIPAA